MNKESDRNEEIWRAHANGWIEFSNSGNNIHRDFLDTPKFLEFLPKNVKKLHALDVGCGDGYNTRLVAKLGVEIIGIDISEGMIEYARNREDKENLGVKYHICNAESLPFSNQEFDFCIATMSLMDMTHPKEVLEEIYRVLKQGGFFQFSILHPCYMTPIRKHIRNSNGIEIALEVGKYFDEGEYEEIWGVEHHAQFKTIHYHRTLSSWINMISESKFKIERVTEPFADEKIIETCPHLEHTRNAPNTIIFRCRK